MNFGEKLNAVISVLGASNAELSRSAAIDASLICRFKKGTKIPSKNSVQFLKLIDGVCKLAHSKNKCDDLLKLCGCNSSETATPLNQAIINWLCLPDRINSSTNNQKKSINKRSRDMYFFGEKLSSLMNLLDISNVRLARSLNVDASLISRYRNGIRTPNTEGELLCKICKYFVNRAVSLDQQSALARMVGCGTETIDGGKLYDSVYGWLVQNGENSVNTEINRFLEQLNRFNEYYSETFLNVKEALSVDVATDLKDKYYGTDGLKDAIIRFMNTVNAQSEPQNIYIYAEQALDWIAEDKEFVELWKTLMVNILNKGSRIRVIHNIDHNIAEMFYALEKWFPFYMTGQIEPYYCRKNADSRFNRDLFVAEDLCAVVTEYVRGTECQAQHRFYTDKQDITYEQNQIKVLLSYASPLVQIFPAHEIRRYYAKLDEISRQDGNVAMLLSVPSLYTMPKSLVIKILERHDFSFMEQEEILTCYEDHLRIFKEALKNGQVTEFVVTPDDDDLMNGRVPNVLCGYTDHKTIFYTPAEYCEHLKHISKLTELYPNYNYKPIVENEFQNIEIIDKSGVGTLVIKCDNPVAVVNFLHPLMCNAFRKYLHSYNEKSLKYYKDRESVLNMLLLQKIEI